MWLTGEEVEGDSRLGAVRQARSWEDEGDAPASKLSDRLRFSGTTTTLLLGALSYEKIWMARWPPDGPPYHPLPRQSLSPRIPPTPLSASSSASAISASTRHGIAGLSEETQTEYTKRNITQFTMNAVFEVEG